MTARAAGEGVRLIGALLKRMLILLGVHASRRPPPLVKNERSFYNGAVPRVSEAHLAARRQQILDAARVLLPAQRLPRHLDAGRDPRGRAVRRRRLPVLPEQEPPGHRAGRAGDRARWPDVRRSGGREDPPRRPARP